MSNKRRLPLQRLSLNEELNIHSNSFLPNSAFAPCLLYNQKVDIRSTTTPTNLNQSRMFDLKYNEGVDLCKQSLNAQLLSPCVVNVDRQYRPSLKSRNKQNIYVKISQLIKNEDLPVNTCNLNTSKQFVWKQRPHTSMSARPRSSLDQSFNKCNVVLHLTKQPEQPADDVDDVSRISTSRALINFSKVYKNGSTDRFKVKKNKDLMISKFSQLSAQKIVFHEKEKKEKKDISKPSLRQMMNRRGKTIGKGVNRYAKDDQQFEIAGWDFTQ